MELGDFVREVIGPPHCGDEHCDECNKASGIVTAAAELAALKEKLAEKALVAMVNASMRIAFALVDTPADEFLGESLEITRAIRNHCGLEA